ncbi:hypothetical protein FOL47_005009 [Perkinsus chesapeaki]|uniref:Uncharacterized protein n=1 Tax=Perkinsus chesapeaki TaxID=330153 RepID=A0A7J6LZI2_PERCH|nr:hypothetical protein FOL47_005009 [Perkinsus chesapeaki]
MSSSVVHRIPTLPHSRLVLAAATRHFSTGPTFTTGVLRWEHRTQNFNKYEYALVTPTDDHVGFKSRRSAPQPRYLFFPSFSLVSSREEWRATAKHLAELGHTSAVVDWPGFALKDGFANWAMLEDVFQGTLVSTYTHFAYQVLDHFSSRSRPFYVVVAGGQATIYVLRALRELETEKKQKIAHVVATSPTWLAYLRRWVGEDKPKALARRQQYIEKRLPEMLATWFRLSRMYSGKGMVKRIMKRQMDANSITPQLIFQKRVILRRHRPYQLDTAMIVGRTDPVQDTVTFMREILQGTRPQWEGSAGLVHTESPEMHAALADSDDEDDMLLSLKVPKWSKKLEEEDKAAETRWNSTAEAMHCPPLTYLLPTTSLYQADERTIENVKEAIMSANRNDLFYKEIPGGLAMHEEVPAVVADHLDTLHASGSLAASEGALVDEDTADTETTGTEEASGGVYYEDPDASPKSSSDKPKVAAGPTTRCTDRRRQTLMAGCGLLWCLLTELIEIKGYREASGERWCDLPITMLSCSPLLESKINHLYLYWGIVADWSFFNRSIATVMGALFGFMLFVEPYIRERAGPLGPPIWLYPISKIACIIALASISYLFVAAWFQLELIPILPYGPILACAAGLLQAVSNIERDNTALYKYMVAQRREQLRAARGATAGPTMAGSEATAEDRKKTT